MPIVQTTEQVIARAQQIRIRTLESVDQELQKHHGMREEQIKLSQQERSKLNFLAFGIVGAVLGLSPELLGDTLVAIGLATLLFDAFVFGYMAECIQRNLNIKNFEDAIKELQDAAKPYFDSYDAMLHYLDDHGNDKEDEFRKGFQAAYDDHQNKYIQYLNWQRAREPRLAPKTKLAIGYWYFAVFAAGLVIIGCGLFLRYS
jgi:hypothetical protein